MTLKQTMKFANHVFRLLKITDLSFPIGRTNKGELSMKFTKDREDFEIILDAVPLNLKEYDNRELKSLVEKYIFESEADYTINISAPVVQQASTATIVKLLPKKKRGRPAKVK